MSSNILLRYIFANYIIPAKIVNKDLSNKNEFVITHHNKFYKFIKDDNLSIDDTTIKFFVCKELMLTFVCKKIRFAEKTKYNMTDVVGGIYEIDYFFLNVVTIFGGCVNAIEHMFKLMTMGVDNLGDFIKKYIYDDNLHLKIIVGDSLVPIFPILQTTKINIVENNIRLLEKRAGTFDIKNFIKNI